MRFPWVALLACGAGLLASVLPVASAFAYTADGLLRGELWRLFTCHLVQYENGSLRWDLLAFAICATLVERQSRRTLVVTLLLGAPLLSCAFWLGCPEVTEYRGLAGMDAALAVELLVMRGFAGQGRAVAHQLGPWLTRAFGRDMLYRVGLVSLARFAGKAAYELSVGHALLAHDFSGVALLPAAHAFGALMGVAVCGALAALRGEPRSVHERA